MPSVTEHTYRWISACRISVIIHSSSSLENHIKTGGLSLKHNLQLKLPKVSLLIFMCGTSSRYFSVHAHITETI